MNIMWGQIAHLYCGYTLGELCSAACDAYWDETIADLTHDDSPICAPGDGSLDGGKLFLPIWPYLV